MGLRRIAMLQLLPTLRWQPAPAWPVIDETARANSPDLAREFELLDGELWPAFNRATNEALRSQNQFRFERLSSIGAGALVAILGIVQVSVGGGLLSLGLTQALVAALASVVALVSRETDSARAYADSLVLAQTLRGEAFRFLARTPPYADEATRLDSLRARIRSLTPDDAQ
jgi:hypothetical protein